LRRCKQLGIMGHPARFPEKLPDFFIRMLPDPSDLVVDIFAGSNTTGAVAERLQRKWVGIETRIDYVSASTFRFIDRGVSKNRLKEIYASVKSGNKFDLEAYQGSESLFGAVSVG